MKTLSKITVLLLAAALMAVGCGDDSDDGTTKSAGTGGTGGAAGMAGMAGMGGTGGSADAGVAQMNIVETAVAAGSFTKLADALTTADLVDTLSGAGPFTVFAPTDAAFDAFEAANPGVLGSLSVEELTAILTYHVISGEVTSDMLVDQGVAATVNGAPVAFDLSGDAMVNDAMISTVDIGASNGVIHVIDSIILPPADDIVATAIGAGNFTELAGALTAADLVDDLQGEGPFTVFAPNDAAFAKFESDNPGVLAGLSTAELTNVLLYHVVPGLVGAGNLQDGTTAATLLDGESVDIDLSMGAMVDGANITATNILTSNGVIHVIDTIIVP